MASVRSYWKVPPCLMEPIPAGSKTNLPLAQAETISDGISISGIMYLSRAENQQQLQQREYVRDKSLQTSGSVKAGKEFLQVL